MRNPRRKISESQIKSQLTFLVRNAVVPLSTLEEIKDASSRVFGKKDKCTLKITMRYMSCFLEETSPDSWDWKEIKEFSDDYINTFGKNKAILALETKYMRGLQNYKNGKHRD